MRPEQAVIGVDAIYDALRDRFSRHCGHLLSPAETDAVRAVLMVGGAVNPAIVGQSATRIAAMAGFEVPQGTQLLIGESRTFHPTSPLHAKSSVLC